MKYVKCRICGELKIKGQAGVYKRRVAKGYICLRCKQKWEQPR